MTDYIFLVIGILLLGVGALYMKFFLDGRRCRIPAEAVIVGVKRDRSGKSIRYIPVVEFNASGQKVKKEAPGIYSLMPGKYNEGDTLEIYYEEGRPENFKVKGKTAVTNLLTSVFMFIVGVGLIILFFKK